MKINWLIKLSILLSGLLLSFVSIADITSNNTIQTALHALYNDTGGDNWTKKDGWSGTAPISCTGTFGLSCDSAGTYVDEIILPSNNLDGRIPGEIGTLTGLIYLHLQGNNLKDIIPAELGNLSASLKDLYLYDNQLEGSLPEKLGSLTNLLNFQFHNNQLSGNIPATYGNLVKLWTFYTGSNKLSGELPTDLINLPSGIAINLKWNAAFSSNTALNDFINSKHLGTYEPSQTTPPTSVSILSKTPTSVELGWSAFDTSPSTTGGYKILQTTSLGEPFKQVGPDIDNRSVTGTTINNLLAGVNYWFKVCNYTDSHPDNPKNMVISEDSVAVSKGVPAVTARVDQTVNELTTVNLSSSASDTDGTINGYSWSQLSGATVVLTGANSAAASFTAPEVTSSGDVLTFRITVTDNDGDIAYDDVQITVKNVLVPPMVSAGLDQTVNEGNAVSLTATASDPNGTIVSYLWKLDEGPVVTLSGETTAVASFTAPSIDIAIESLLFTVTVTDNDGGIATSSVLVTVNNVLIPPTVNAGLDQTVNEGSDVTLLASAADSNGTIADYYWEQLSGSAVILSDQTTATASFTAPLIDIPSENLMFKVTVTDNDGQTSSDTVQVTVNNIPFPPTVNAGLDQTVDEGTTVTLSASASDTNGTVSSYLWQQVSGTHVVIVGNNLANASFSGPLINIASTVLEFKVTVTDNEGASATDTVRITVMNVFVAPTVSAGLDITAFEGDLVSFNASASDPNGTVVSYLWEQISVPKVLMDGSTTATPSFIAPAIDSGFMILEFKVTVTDNDGAMVSDSIQVTVNNKLIPPTVNPGTDQIVNEGDAVSLTADARDPNGTIIGYSWNQISGTVVALSAANTASVNFVAPKVTKTGDVLVFEVTVTDNDGQAAKEQVQVTVNDVKIEPDANPSTDLPGDEVEEGNWIELNANAFDVDGEVVTYYWEQLLGPTVELETTDTPTTRFEAPTITNRSVRLLFRVTVTDDDELIGSGLIYVIITKKNVIVVGNGALSWFWLMLMGMPLLGRRFLK